MFKVNNKNTTVFRVIWVFWKIYQKQEQADLNNELNYKQIH